jgi:hypothetical protein
MAEGEHKPFTAADIRFTRKGNLLYAICLDKPAEAVRIEALGKSSAAGIEIVEIKRLGAAEPLVWSCDDNALTIRMPAAMEGEYAFVFSIGLKGCLLGKPRLTAGARQQDAGGRDGCGELRRQNFGDAEPLINGKAIATPRWS